MPSPFPGMDPYLESPAIWPDVHHGLVSETRAALNQKLRPQYVVRIGVRSYAPDDARLIDGEVEEGYAEIHHVALPKLVTVIEVVSPTNKIRGARGRTSFMNKREETLASDVHWVEIDLLRAGMPSVTRPPLQPSDYRILVSRAEKRSKARYWPVSVREPLPVIGVPLRVPDPDVPLDLGEVLRTAYERGAYDLSVDYRRKPDPPLKGDDARWAETLLRQRGLR